MVIDLSLGQLTLTHRVGGPKNGKESVPAGIESTPEQEQDNSPSVANFVLHTPQTNELWVSDAMFAYVRSPVSRERS